MKNGRVTEQQADKGNPDALRDLRVEIAGRPWKECAELLTADILAVAKACADRQLPIIEIKQFCVAFSIATATLLELMDRPQKGELLHLMAAMQALSQALRQRGAEESVQGEYAEARVSSCRSLCQNHDPALDGFPKLVELSRKVCSEETAGYLSDTVRLGYDQFLDMLQMLASDQADWTMVANPPARIRAALTHQRARQEMLDRQRWESATPQEMDRLDRRKAPRDVESEVIAEVDWEHTKRDLSLPPDESVAIEARMDGLNLQSADAADELGWDARRLSAVRRSLAGDRRWGQRLRKRLTAYGPNPDSAKRPSRSSNRS
jgi:hypothetical protein